MVIVIGFIWGGTQYGMVTALMLVAHVLSMVVVWPAAIIANFAALRIFRPRSWRHEPWRAWLAGSLGVPCVWGGMAAWPYLTRGSPEFINSWGSAGKISLLVLFSNLAVFIGWILPSRRSRGTVKE
jgi:hypothetical protein